MRAMKIRDIINTQKRKAVIAASSGMVLFTIGFLTSSAFTGMMPLVVIGFAVAMGGITFMEFGLSCPHCQGHIGCAIHYPGKPFSISPKVRFCPLCGVSLDSVLRR